MCYDTYGIHQPANQVLCYQYTDYKIINNRRIRRHFISRIHQPTNQMLLYLQNTSAGT